ncbi:MAG: hypothetical protein HQL31_12915, partial [Planctomycetes bacterium]|nr:hypothetical protein [Planctomycetota bacterium]
MSERMVKTTEQIVAQMGEFSITRYALLVDRHTRSEDLPQLKGMVECVGAFTFDFSTWGTTVAGHEVVLLNDVKKPVTCNAWLVCTVTKAGYALNAFLAEAGCEEQIIFPLYQIRLASMYSYIDFFRGEMDTVLYLPHHFERTYKVHLPIAVRYLFKDCKGRVVKTGQVILWPNQTRVFDSRKLPELGESFEGYLELYADIRHVNSRITPFYHMYVDYLTADAIMSNHQSGLKPWPANIRFYRGFVPDNPDEEMIVSVFNKENTEPIFCMARVEFERGGEQQSVERNLTELPKGEMHFINLNKLFADVLTPAESRPLVTIWADKAMHRPNFYVRSTSRKGAYIDVNHGCPSQTRRKEQIFSPEEMKKFAKARAFAWHNDMPLLPTDQGMDTIAIYFNESPIEYSSFMFIFHDHDGREVLRKNLNCPAGTMLSLRKMASVQGLTLDKGGLVRIAPRMDTAQVPTHAHFMLGFVAEAAPYIITNVAGGTLLNVPFNLIESSTWMHPGLPIVHS